MLGRLLLGSSVLIGTIALFLSQWLPSSKPGSLPVTGLNNTVLFISNSELGLSNVQVASAYALLERHPEVQVHFASFTPMASRLRRISEYGRQKTSATREVVFHELPGQRTFVSAMVKAGRTLASMIHPPGYAGISTIVGTATFIVSPWSGEDHFTLYQEITDIIDEVDPALVVLDPFFRPGIDAARMRNRLYAFISPNPPIDTFPLEQPYRHWLWKYPIMGSGISYPVPWRRLPENIYLNLRYHYAMVVMPYYRDIQKFLYSKGLTDRVTFYNLHRSNVPWFTTSLPGASIPLDVIPPNVTCVGPITLSLSTAEEQSPSLAEWLSHAPTVLINLGGLYPWSEDQAAAMAQAVADVLSTTADLQVLWKLLKAPSDDSGATYNDTFAAPLRPFIDSGRVRIEPWLEVDPPSLLETGHIIASVHHGGSGSFNEALGTGVTQMALPQWLDHYSFAQLAEDIGVGVWGCRETSPKWTAACLRDALSTVVGHDEISMAMREKVKQFGDQAQSNPGQYVVAREIAKLAASGHGP
ncbi:hypothetical protein F5Y13DRAFT_202088 [Hypoxylon sp. FL1857]|nr:hypothetical protein F5Y13DRAFT_202088 [Hypoxylon sp. FL1857]